MKVLVADPIGKEGIDLLVKHGLEVDIKTGLKPEELLSIIPEYEALLVRSETKVTAQVLNVGRKLCVVGRAGVGVDNIDLATATERGIIVVNAPESNTLSAAEHTVALMLALARNIPQAHAALKAGKWDRKRFTGIEVRNKTIGVIGLGKVGTEVAKRCKGLDMQVIGYDPMVSAEHARNRGIEMVSLDELLSRSDFITIHVPLTPATKGLIGEEALRKVKTSVRILNVARGGVVDEEALFRAIEEGRVAGAAIDVFSKEPATENILLKSDKVVVTPHLGASTVEAQAGVAVDVAEQVIEVLQGLPARYCVNMPMVPREALPVLTPYIRLATLAGSLVAQITEGQLSTITITYEGEITQHPTDALKAAVIGGLLESTTEERVNIVNANLVAQRRGLKVIEQKSTECENYASLITVEVSATGGITTAAGTILRGQPHIVRVNEYWLDIVPTGSFWLFSDHMDRPGIIAAVAAVTGEADINISYMHVARQRPRGRALMILALDEPLGKEHIEKILAIPDIYTAKSVKL